MPINKWQGSKTDAISAHQDKGTAVRTDCSETVLMVANCQKIAAGVTNTSPYTHLSWGQF